MTEKEQNQKSAYDRAIHNLREKVKARINQEALIQVGHEENCLQAKVLKLLEEFLKSHQVKFHRATNVDYPDSLAEGLRQLCQEAANRAVEAEMQRVIERIGEEIVKEN